MLFCLPLPHTLFHSFLCVFFLAAKDIFSLLVSLLRRMNILQPFVYLPVLSIYVSVCVCVSARTYYLHFGGMI